jgi:hypothetical protein
VFGSARSKSLKKQTESLQRGDARSRYDWTLPELRPTLSLKAKVQKDLARLRVRAN